jgi:ribosomal protein S18 acetylase RimI-like enzyme
MRASPFAAAPHDLGACRLEPMTPPDAATVAARLPEMDPWRRLGYHAAALAPYLTQEDPSLTRWALYDGDALAGSVAVRFPWLRGPYLELLAVFPEAQGRGVGAAVLGALQRAAAHEGNLWAMVSAFNENARRFYRRHGFAEIGRVPALVRPGHDELLLRWVPGPAGRMADRRPP